MRLFFFVPLLVIAAAIYGAFAISAGDNVSQELSNEIISLTLPSGAAWQLTLGHVFIILGVVCLFLELLKSTNPTDSAIAEISISGVCSLIFLLLFVLARPFGTSEFFLITVMAFLDFLVGCFVLVSTARRTIDHEG
jgi:hypothetical protein